MITIIIPIYNAEKNLRSIIQCLFNQTYTNFEVILIDDGSTDSTGKICDDVVKKDNRFNVIHQKNSGVAVARNIGLDIAKGEYITFLDADDKIPLNYLEVLLNKCIENDADISICDVVIIEKEYEINRFSMNIQSLTSIDALNELFIRKNINSGPCAKLFKREIIDKIRFPSLKTYEDILFVKDVFNHATKITVTNETAYYYIQNNNGAMSKMFKSPSLDIIYATDEILTFIKEKGNLNEKTVYISISHVMQYVNLILNNISEKNNDFLDKAINLFKKYRRMIFKCSAFPWKEKIVYILFSFGFLYKNRKFIKL